MLFFRFILLSKNLDRLDTLVLEQDLSLPAAGQYSDQNDDAFQDLLIIGLHIEQVQQIIDHSKGDHTCQGAKRASATAAQDGTTDDTGSNGIQLEPHAHARL
jgi:hypothetical protein